MSAYQKRDVALEIFYLGAAGHGGHCGGERQGQEIELLLPLQFDFPPAQALTDCFCEHAAMHSMTELRGAESAIRSAQEDKAHT